ncbi:MAG TPA: 2OG-Fe(II) oxygenase [Thermoanaerobaculia bacterium]|nr:2OG-Fe(II) oxygenase [Thermoanaerobaculia bacterium]
MIQLNADPTRLHDEYVQAAPFPHIAIDGLFEDEELAAVLREFPGPDEIQWRRFDNEKEKKLGYTYKSEVGPRLQNFLYFMNSAPVLEFLQALTGIDGLIPDPYYGGAGPHQILPGGFLNVHVDFNWHPLLRLDRRLNLIVYLNREWREEYGGHLELWDRDVTRCVQKILPVFNRTVIFNTTDFSYHGHPHPLRCPPPMSRKSVSLYYYSNGRPAEERSAPHDTVFPELPDHHDHEHG